MGCSLGECLKFKLKGWQTKGKIPTKNGNLEKKLFKLDLDIVNAEKMKYKQNHWM